MALVRLWFYFGWPPHSKRRGVLSFQSSNNSLAFPDSRTANWWMDNGGNPIIEESFNLLMLGRWTPELC